MALIAAGVSVVATAVSQIDYAGAYRSLKQAGTKIKNAASDIAETVKEGLEWTSNAIKNLVREASNTLLSESQNADNDKDSGTAKTVKSRIKEDNRLKRAAEEMGKNERMQQDADNLIRRFVEGGKARMYNWSIR